MPMPEPGRTLLICCGAIAREIVALVGENGWDHMDVQCLPARLHNTPKAIPEAIRDKIQTARDSYDKIFVLYGDCGTGGRLDAMLREEDVERVFGNHCYEVFAGSEELAQSIAAEPGTFFLTDFLARHFERLVIRGLGRARRAARRLGLAFEMRYTGYGGYERFLAARAACPKPSVGQA